MTETYQKIKTLVYENPRGLSIHEISTSVGINRNTITRYIDVLVATGQIEMRSMGKAKLYYPSKRVTLDAMLNFTNNGVIILNSKLEILQVNDVIEKRVTIKPEKTVTNIIQDTEYYISCIPEVKSILRKVLIGEQVSQEISYTFNNSSFFCKISGLPTTFTDGTKGCTLIFEDISERKKAENALLYNNSLLNTISKLSTKFINLSLDDIDNGINDALKTIGSFVGVDRSYVFQLQENNTAINNTHEWCATGITSEINNLQNIPIKAIPWWMEKMFLFENIHIPCVLDLPPEASNEKKILLAQKIQSLLVVPLVYKQTLIGFIGFDSVLNKKKWDNETIQLLHVVGEIITNALERKRTEIRLKATEDNFNNFFSVIDDMIFVGDPKGNIYYTNTAVSRTLGYSIEELKKMHILAVHSKNHRKEAELIFSEMFNGKRDICPLPLQRKDGVLVPVETRVWFGKWDGKDCIFGISKNLSKEQEALQKFNKLFDNNPALMAVSTVDDGKYVNVNSAFLQTLGFSSEEVIGNTSEKLDLFIDSVKKKEVQEELKRNKKIKNYVLKIKAKNGKIINGLFSGDIIESQGVQYFLTVMLNLDNYTIIKKEKTK